MPRKLFLESYEDIIAMPDKDEMALQNYFDALYEEEQALKVVLPEKGFKLG